MPSASPEIPSTRVALWRSLKLGYRAEPLLIVIAGATTIGAAVPDALFALGLKVLAQRVLDGDDGGILFAAVLLGALAVLTWLLKLLSERANRKFADRCTVVIESHVARLQASVASIEHHERPDYLDRLAILRDQVFTLNHLYGSLFGMAGSVLRLVLTVGLLMSVHPALVLLGAAALPTVVVSSRRSLAERAASEAVAGDMRLARHLFQLGTTAPPAKELRVARTSPRVIQQRREAWDRWYGVVSRSRWTSAVAQSSAWAVFGVAYVATVVFVSSGIEAGPGDVLLVLAAGSRLSAYVGQTEQEANFLSGFWLDASRRLAWLEDYAAVAERRADAAVPDRLTEGIRMEGVSFRYPGTDAVVLEDVNLDLPAGAVVAIVGENGAGKSTLVKLLCRFYEPDSGRILVDGADQGAMPADEWRRRCAGAFQDFFRFELPVRHSVGVGDLDRLDERPAVEAALGRAGAGDVVDGLVSGIDTQLGPTWRDGVEVSFGQWQKFALARGFMRDDPLLLVLDEPTAALDAETEHALFERYAAASRNDDGRITILVSHRFSTVRMADLIVVLDGARVVEYGSHPELMARGGQYAELYGIQAASYR
ncbi:MAG: ABC transporter ATP-binding protein/permease [Actinomycetota bacterium]|nr:ABC transporter ATP-binding protein/permease [Actinomycetota bacterium]